MRVSRVVTVVLSLIVFLLPAGAQTTAGSIVGTVTDPSGAVIGGAGITVTNIDTGIATKTATDNSGNYVVTPL
ncbi:MAG TPA: carboxypeptidase-like regulatory domain-containing protein, partial [Bryobacteraceae bacterium]|nr:carboxypeptidase-like regulatory domain-containing protein [Bryobacteraceae bacterium]